MRYVVVTILAAVLLLGVIGGAVTHAQQDAKWADVLWVYDGKEWIPYVDGMTIPTGMPKFRGNTGDISSVQVALNGKQVGMNELSVGYTFIKAQKTLLQNGTYTLTVRDCGMIVEPPNVGECSLDTADLDVHPILFTGMITIKDPTQELGMVPPPPPPLPESKTPELKWASIESVWDGERWMPFKSHMTVHDNMPKFRGSSGGIDSVQITLDDHQVDTNEISDTGNIAKAQKFPLSNGTYKMIVRDCGPIVEGNNKGACAMPNADLSSYAVLFDGTIRIGQEPTATEELGTMEAMKLKIAELKAMIAAMNATITDMLTRMNSANQPTWMPPPPPPLWEIPEQVPGQYYMRLLNSTNSIYGIGDHIHFEGKLPACPPPIMGTLGGVITDHGGTTKFYLKIPTNKSPGSSWITHEIKCNSMAVTEIDPDDAVRVPLNHTTVSGFISVESDNLIGEHTIFVKAERGYYKNMTSNNYYTETFMLGNSTAN